MVALWTQIPFTKFLFITEMVESGTGRMQLTSDSHHSSATLSKAEANRDCKNVNGSLSSKCSNTATKKLSSEEVGRKYVQIGVADVEPCPKGHICHKCNSSLFGDSSVYYGAPDYVPVYSRSFTETRSTYNTEAVMDESGTEIGGNFWLGSYHY